MWDDVESQNPFDVYDFMMHGIILKQLNTFVHCQKSCSRSPRLIIAYSIRYYGVMKI